MTDLCVKVEYFFQNPEGFPWDILGLSRPHYGPLHSYLCDAAALFCEPAERDLLRQRPALFELRRWADLHSGIFQDIVNVADREGDPKCRFQKAKIVVEWLQYRNLFVKYMQGHLDRAWRQGLITLPEGARPKHV